MNQSLKTIQDLLQQNRQLTELEREDLLKAITDADKQWNIIEFKLDRTEKVKKTTAILLEETIEELEQKRKAVEAQNRELEIEAALERVRTIAMSMNAPADMPEVCKTIAHQLKLLGVKEIRNVQTAIFYEEKGTYMNYEYYAKHDKTIITETSYTNHKMHRAFAEQMLKGKGEFFSTLISKAELPNWIAYQKTTNVFIDTYIETASSLNYYWYSLGPVALGISTYLPLSEEAMDLFKRFLKVFELAYRRYLDIAKAETQAREAEIQLALERVRARTMAMQRSDELSETAYILFQQFRQLGDLPIQITIGVFNEEKKAIEFRITGFDGSGSQIDRAFNMSIDKATLLKEFYEAWKEQKPSTIVELKGQELLDWVSYRNSVAGNFFPTIEEISLDDRRFVSAAFFAKGLISFSKPEPIGSETIHILERFASVFDQTYTRFLDLQKAEAQAREATIEAALEKVRGKAMAMHDSNDLSNTASMVFTELRKLGISPIRCGVGLLNTESLKAPLYSVTSSANGDSLSMVGWVMLSDHPVLEEIYKAWQRGEDYFPELSGEQLKSYYESLLTGLSLPSTPDWQAGQTQYGHFISFSVGCLYAWSDHSYSDAQVKILKRFATIIDLTFRRYLELQKSEANAKEAIKQAALDRIRADIASMRTISDLDRITPLIWNELTTLGIPFTRCGVFIMDDEQELIHTFLSAPDGKAIAAFHLPFDTPGNISKIIKHWRQKENYISHWDKNEFKSLADSLVQQGAVATRAQYLNTLPEEGIFLNFLPFLQGMLYVGNTTQLAEEEIKLVQSVADAFSTAYARYEDFNKLEAAKRQAEKTLVDLKQAQQQLIQSEKMASLGELTAGIAHEIQNPLNFVNNFSEVNGELLSELVDEVEKENFDEVRSIAKDIKENEEKINHHGKRADAIVKGMLQHSRTSSGQKELTDINVLADEYLRLSYHGLRAKDKSFNAKFETDFDYTIDKINIIPQDIGRVILNLINNAFYAVNEKKKTAGESYQPTVSIITKHIHSSLGVRGIEITVKDNGSGIPQSIVDKIFQPFFTTKPTGQGTGLGLSLAYDIIKAHGGEIKVESKEGEASELVIQLPIV